MEKERLTQLIVEEVYRRLQLDNNNQVQKPGKTMVVLWEKDLSKYSFLEKEYQVMSYSDTIRSCDAIVVTKLCLRGLANLSMGANVSNEERLVLKSMMQGKKVYVLEGGLEYRRYKHTAPKTLYNLYLQYENTLRSYGVEIIKDIGSLRIGATTAPITSYSQEAIIDFTGKKLITEVDIKRAIEKGEEYLSISKKCILTPLAEDFIRSHHLKVERR